MQWALAAQPALSSENPASTWQQCLQMLQDGSESICKDSYYVVDLFGLFKISGDLTFIISRFLSQLDVTIGPVTLENVSHSNSYSGTWGEWSVKVLKQVCSLPLCRCIAQVLHFCLVGLGRLCRKGECSAETWEQAVLVSPALGWCCPFLWGPLNLQKCSLAAEGVSFVRAWEVLSEVLNSV